MNEDPTWREFWHRNSRPHSKENRLGKHIANIIISIIVIQLGFVKKGFVKKGDSEIADRIVDLFNKVMIRLFGNELPAIRCKRNTALKSHLQYVEAWGILSMSGKVCANNFIPTSVNGMCDYMRVKGANIRTLLIMVLFEDDDKRGKIDRFLDVLAQEQNLDTALVTLHKYATEAHCIRSSRSPIAAFGPLVPKEVEYAEEVIKTNTLVIEMELLSLSAETADDKRRGSDDELESPCSNNVSENSAMNEYAGAAVDYEIPDESCIDEPDGENGDETAIDNDAAEEGPSGVKTRGKSCPKNYYGEYYFF